MAALKFADEQYGLASLSLEDDCITVDKRNSKPKMAALAVFFAALAVGLFILSHKYWRNADGEQIGFIVALPVISVFLSALMIFLCGIWKQFKFPKGKGLCIYTVRWFNKTFREQHMLFVKASIHESGEKEAFLPFKKPCRILSLALITEEGKLFEVGKIGETLNEMTVEETKAGSIHIPVEVQLANKLNEFCGTDTKEGDVIAQKTFNKLAVRALIIMTAIMIACIPAAVFIPEFRLRAIVTGSVLFILLAGSMITRIFFKNAKPEAEKDNSEEQI